MNLDTLIQDAMPPDPLDDDTLASIRAGFIAFLDTHPTTARDEPLLVAGPEEAIYAQPEPARPTPRRRSGRTRYMAAAAVFVVLVGIGGLVLARQRSEPAAPVLSFPTNASCEAGPAGAAIWGLSGDLLAGPGGDGLCVGLFHDAGPSNEGIVGVALPADPTWRGPRVTIDICSLIAGQPHPTTSAASGNELVYFGIAQAGVDTVVLRDDTGHEYRVQPTGFSPALYAFRLPDIGPLTDVAWLDANGNPVEQGLLPEECADPARRSELQAARADGWSEYNDARFDPATGTLDTTDPVHGWVRVGTKSFDDMKASIDFDTFGNQRMKVYDEPNGRLIGYSYSVLGFVDTALADSGTFNERAIVTVAIGCYPNSDAMTPDEALACTKAAATHFKR